MLSPQNGQRCVWSGDSQNKSLSPSCFKLKKLKKIFPVAQA